MTMHPTNTQRPGRTARILRIGHRGAPYAAPANTMASFRAAHAAGCDWVECDCRMAADGCIVLSHDPTVTDRSGEVYRVDQTPTDELAALDLGAGEGVATLEELVAWAASRVGVMADVKADGCEEAIGETLSPIPAARKIVPGADDEGRRRFRALFPDLPLSLSVGAGDEDELLRRWDTIDTEAVTLQHALVTPERVADLRRRGIRVYAWTVDDVETMRALADMGVDGLISNRADRLANL